jgi:uncharacterized Fe-S cluster-containing radical SAM superfamily protein
MKKLNFICSRVLKEIVILAGGRITTCCLDPQGLNTFANIHKNNFGESVKKFQLFREKLAADPGHFPLCVQCFMSRKKKKGAAYDHFLKENPGREEIASYVKGEIAPQTLVIEVTSACNLTCIGCPTGLRNRNKEEKDNLKQNIFINIDKLKTWISPYMKKLNRIRLFNYGEPLLHPGTIDFSSFLTIENPKIDLIIATNLLPLNNEKKIRNFVKAQPTMIIVSLHGTNRESLVKYMGSRADFDGVLKIMKQIIDERNRLGLTLPIVIWKYILFHWNDSDQKLNEAKALAKEHSIDYLGFEITGGELASKRFYKGSADFEKLKKSGFFAGSIYNKIFKEKTKRRIFEL